jgi:medium-chain acyl-[acyl-carrier-protein] hydrolase
LQDKEGNILAQADLLWVLIDVNTRRPMPFKKIIDRVNIPDACPALIDTELRLAEEFTETATVEFCASRRDVDFNGHINNSAYLVWALDTLPADCTPEGSPSRIHLAFRKECMLGAEVEIQHYRSGNFTRHIINSAEGIRAEVDILWS